MKYFIFLFSCVSLVVGFSDDYMKKLQPIIDDCQKDYATQATEDWLATGESYKVPCLGIQGAHIFCRLKKLGSIKENGDVDKEAMEKDLTSGIGDPKLVKAILEKCSTRKPGTSPVQSAVNNFICVLSTYDQLKEQPKST